jgi:hypothetical protein
MSPKRIPVIFFTFLIVFLGVSGVITPAQAAPMQQTAFSGEELLGRPTDTSITINIVPAVNIELYYAMVRTLFKFVEYTQTECP